MGVSVHIMAVRRTDISEELTCPVCQEEFEDPRILPCGHNYCQKCIVQLLITVGVPFPCPECRKDTVLPSNDPNQLPRAQWAVRMKEKLTKQSQQLCSEHDEPMKLFCNGCKLRTCINCALIKHRGHDYQLVTDVAQRFSNTVGGKIAALAKERGALYRTYEANRSAHADVLEQESSIAAKINTSFEELFSILQQRKEELLLEAGVYMNARRDALDGQLRELNETITQLRGIGETAEGILMDEETLLERHEEVEKSIDDKLEECRKFKFKPAAADVSKEEMSVEVISANELAALVKAQCRIISQAETFTSSTVVDGILPTVDLLCATPATVTISNGIEGTSSTADVKVNFKSVTAHGECDVYETSSGVFEFTYCGTRRGQHRLSMEVNGKHLGHSVLVTLPPNRLGKLVRVIEPVFSPTSMAINSNNLLFVNESGSFPRLAVMDRFGKSISFIKCSDIIYPNGLAVDKDGMIYITDICSNSLLKFDPQGILLLKTGCTGSQPGQFDVVCEIAIVNDELLYVSDNGNHRIQVFDKNLTFLFKFGRHGSNLGEFDGPGDLAYSTIDKELFIADSNNHRIQVFTCDGKPVRVFGGAGLFTGKAKLIKPFNICFDKSEKFLLIADIEGGRILVFTTMGKYVSSFSSKGSGMAQLDSPSRVAMDSDGYVYVCDSENNKIVVF